MLEPEEIKGLRDEIDELRQTLNENTRAVNYLTQYLAEQSRLIAEHWYRFILWMRPFQLAVYVKPARIRRLYRADPSPLLTPLSENGDKDGADWERPARVFLPNVAKK